MSYDSVALQCNPDLQLAENQSLFITSNSGTQYYIGSITSYTDSGAAIAQLYSSAGFKPFLGSSPSLYDNVYITPSGNGSFVFELPSSVVLSVGSDVYSQEIGFPIGSVTAISQNPNTLVQTLYVRMPISLQRLTTVLVR